MGLANLLLDRYIKVEHLVLDSGSTVKEGFVADLGLAAVKVNIQPVSPEQAVLYGGAYGKGYIIYTTASGILETDRVTTVSGTDSTVYIVKGRQNFNYLLAQHIELYVEETE